MANDALLKSKGEVEAKLEVVAISTPLSSAFHLQLTRIAQ